MRRKLVKRHMARVRADHEHLAVFPTMAVTVGGSTPAAARAEARRLTSESRQHVKPVRGQRKTRTSFGVQLSPSVSWCGSTCQNAKLTTSKRGYRPNQMGSTYPSPKAEGYTA